MAISVAALIGCAHNGEQQLEIPKAPPRTLEVLAESERTDNTFPGGAERVRHGVCGIRLTVAPESLLEEGGIERIQRRLVSRNLLEDGAYQPGELDEPTLAAIRQLQANVDLPEVGLPTYTTVRELDLQPEEVFAASDADCAHSPPGSPAETATKSSARRGS